MIANTYENQEIFGNISPKFFKDAKFYIWTKDYMGEKHRNKSRRVINSNISAAK